jgi:hypothetical protein
MEIAASPSVLFSRQNRKLACADIIWCPVRLGPVDANGARRLLVAALAQAGRLDEAQRELERLKNFQPDISLAWIEKNVPYTPGPMKSYLEGWRKVGLQ